MRIVFMGSPEFAVCPLEYLILNRYEVVAVCTQPDRPAGRGRAMCLPPVKRVAMEWGLAVCQPASLRKPGAVAELESYHPDVIVVAAYGQILPGQLLDVPRYGCLNVHPSLLPRFRGAAPIAAAILAGDEFTGASIMLMDEGMDTGPVLARAQIPVSGVDTTASLTSKLSRIGAQLLLEVLPRWQRGELVPRPQNEAEASYCRLISKEAGQINWRLSAVDIWRRLRAFHPWPGCYTSWRGRRLKIIEAVPLSEMGGVEIGRVVALSSAGGKLAPPFGIGTGEGVLGVLKLQQEGKRVMSAAEFLRGQRGFLGAQLGLS